MTVTLFQLSTVLTKDLSYPVHYVHEAQVTPQIYKHSTNVISLPINQLIVEDTNEDAHIDQNDLNVTLTFAEHQMMCDVLMQAVNAMEFACPYGIYDLPMDSEIVQRYTMIENLRERFNTAWSDRFNKDEIH